MDRLPVIAAVFALCLGGTSAFADPKPDAEFVSAHTRNFTRTGGRSITHVVIHTIEGSAGSARNWFRNPRSKVSAHYIVDFDGALTQMVRDKDRAWHARGFNRNSIGIEHAGYASRNQWTDAQYRGSARLVRWLCDTYGIPKTRERIIGHVEVPRTRHKTDPGRHFNWDYYMRLIRGEAGDLETAGGGATGPDVPVVDDHHNGGHDGHGHGPDPEDEPGPYAVPLSPGRGQTIGLLHTDWRSGSASSGYPGLELRWSVSNSRHHGARVQLQEAGRRGLRYDSGTLSGAVTSHKVTAKLQDGRSYRWRVLVSDGTNTDVSAWVPFRTHFQPATVRAVAPVGGASVGGQVNFRWTYDDPNGGKQASFRIYVDNDTDHSTVIYDTKELNGDATSHSIAAELTPGKTYYWRVMGYDGMGNPSFSRWQTFVAAPVVVTAISPRDGVTLNEGDRPVLRWTYRGPEGMAQTGFRVQMSHNGERTFDSTYSSTSSAFRAKEVKAGAYRWRVGVSDGTNVAWSQWAQFFVQPELRGGIADRVGGPR